jgi:hypothetical protein
MKLTSARIMMRILLAASLAVASFALFGRRSYADEIPKGWEASNLKPIGYSDKVVPVRGAPVGARLDDCRCHRSD